MSRRSRRIQLQHQVEDQDQDDSEDEEMEEGNENGGEDGEEDGENDEEGEEDSEDTDEGYDDDDREGDDGAGDDGDENDENSARKRAGRGRGKVSAGEDSKKAGGRSGKPKTDAIAAGTMTQSVDEMVHSSILYLLLQHHKKLPIKRADIVKNAMNGQLRSFPEVIESVKKIFEEKFGIQLIGVEESRGRISGFSSYILVSKYPQSATEAANNRGTEADTKRAVLYLILAVIFMLGRSIDEDVIWQIFASLHINTLICKKRDDLRRFLKQEYVSPLYLNAEEVKETEQIYYRYSWGLRAEKEISKYEMLKFVAKQFPEKKPYDFTAQYSIVLEHEKDRVEADRAEQEARSSRPDEDMDDGQSQVINFDSEGRVENVELRGEGAEAVTLRGMRPVTPNVASMEVDDNTENVAPNGTANGEAMEEDENASESESESGSGSGTASDEAQEGSDANSVSESSGSGSESESD